MPLPRGSRPAIVAVLGLAPVKIGGMEKFLRYFVLEAWSRGWTTVLCFDGPIAPIFRDYIQHPGCVIHVLQGQGNLGLRAAKGLRRILREHHPAAFVYAFHGVMRCFPLLARASGCRNISFYDHSSRPMGFVPRPLPLPKRLAGRVLTAPLRVIVSVSQFTRDSGTVLGTASAPNVVLSNGIELLPGNRERGRAFRSRFGIGPDAIVIAQLAWMVPVKGVDVMLRAAALVLQRSPAVHFMLAGDGEQRPQYMQMAEDLGIAAKVTFCGLVQDPTAEGLFDAADVYCQPSLWQEACPLAVLEAMSFRIPVVASRTGGLPELVREGETGLLCPAGDANALADALCRIAADPVLRERFGTAGLRQVTASNRIEDVARRYCDLVLNERSVAS